ncbi:MAG: ferredoxin [Candidatus Wallbacteria bacterium HGW-Wallbacteria-1]|jgi:aerobic-type carbon monoxide dehydrogenase small subunit (CoxS/CutS family)|uniref:Ferredoxin n=1 Tax=Candidatus Wallbacteria bacterium HGW-Wallbacteria-1 TaxID=2013854 RepID=A0A2N1PRE9_9BACT|nr:MAG: ferredoxin [Candidatus Wallbacteria bacterium HGW-Wallbacteria-1]
MNIFLKINGSNRNLEVRPDESLLHTLRTAGYLSVKCGCESGGCGTCCVVMNNEVVNSCLINSASAEGSEILTSEGLGTPESPHAIQKAFSVSGAVQCGFCTPGFVMATYALLLRNPDPDEHQIAKALDGNICRCTGHTKIFDAVRLAAEMIREGWTAGGHNEKR